MLNLVQHLTASLYLLPLLGEILKQVQDDVLGCCEPLAGCWFLFFSTEEQKNIFEFGRFSYEAYVLVSDLFCFTLAFGC